MMHIQSTAVIGQATFGRDGAMFEGLLGFVAQLSLMLWSLVMLTTVIRFVSIRIYRRKATVMTTGSVTNAMVQAVQPAEVATVASVNAPSSRRAPVVHALNATHMHSLDANSVKL